MFLKKIIQGLICGVLLLSACAPAATPAPVMTETPLPVPTFTPEPPKVLKVCLGREPVSLYSYASQDRTTHSVLQMLNDGPFDVSDSGEAPIIFTDLPAKDNGGIVSEPAAVSSGFQVQNANGDIDILKKGVRVFPSGCESSECVVEWDGESALQMDQISITFHLNPALKWSDGTPLTARDSVYSYQVASDPATPGTRQYLMRTLTYEAADDHTLVWKGIPGAVPASVSDFFWQPLPEHVLKTVSSAELLTAEASAVKPLSWGPYMIQQWQKGNSMILVKNPSYFRNGEGLPYFDTIEVRFIDSAGSPDLAEWLNSQCDMIDSSAVLDGQYQQAADLVNAGTARQTILWGPELTFLSFGIRPVSYDDSYNMALGDRPDFFGRPEVRTAVSKCIDWSVIQQVPGIAGNKIPVSYTTASAPEVPPQRYSKEEAIQQLEDAGWKDTDHDPLTPRLAQGIPEIMDGTPFSIRLLTSDNSYRLDTAGKLALMLQGCGIQTEVVSRPAAELYQAGPTGELFGRSFDLAIWGLAPSCDDFAAWQIPSAGNAWTGTNISGYSNPVYDGLCQTFQAGGVVRPGLSQESEKALQSILAADVPFLPLYFYPHITLTKPELCNVQPVGGSQTVFSGIENFTFQKDCPLP